jgi:hypothetical protein
MRRILLILFCVLIATAALEAKKKWRGNNDDGYTKFRHEDVQEIQGYYHGQASGLPPGLAKRGGDLPPGLEKKLRRNGQLPPGLQKRIEPFPAGLERRLPPLRRGLSRGLVGGRALIYDPRTMIIADVMVVFGR